MAAAEPVSVEDVVAESVSDVSADAEPHADVEAVSQEHEQEPESTPAPVDGEAADTAEAVDAETPAEAAEPAEPVDAAGLQKPSPHSSARPITVAPAKSAAAEAARSLSRAFCGRAGQGRGESSEVLEVAAGLAEGVEDAGEAQEEVRPRPAHRGRARVDEQTRIDSRAGRIGDGDGPLVRAQWRRRHRGRHRGAAATRHPAGRTPQVQFVRRTRGCVAGP